MSQGALNVAGLVSRFLLHGLRLPDPASTPADPDAVDFAALTIEALYALNGQQFPVDAGQPVCEASLRIADPDLPLAGAIRFADGADRVTSKMPVAPLPPPPSPTWIRPDERLAAGADITVRQVPALEAADLTVAARTRLPWSGPGGNAFVVPLPFEIQTLADEQPIQLTVKTDKGNPEASWEKIGAAPALLVPIRLRRVQRPRTETVAEEGFAVSPYLTHVYQIVGTDDETRARTEVLLESESLDDARLQRRRATSISRSRLEEVRWLPH